MNGGGAYTPVRGQGGYGQVRDPKLPSATHTGAVELISEALCALTCSIKAMFRQRASQGGLLLICRATTTMVAGMPIKATVCRAMEWGEVVDSPLEDSELAFEPPQLAASLSLIVCC